MIRRLEINYLELQRSDRASLGLDNIANLKNLKSLINIIVKILK